MPPVLTPVITASDVRVHMMDYEEINQPLFIRYLEDTDLDTCIESAIDDFNETPPILYRKYTLYDFPFKRLLLDGAIVRAFKLTVYKELRGEMQYNDGGIQASVYYKSPQFIALRQELEQKYENDKARRKRHLNIENCYGGTN